MLFDHSTRHIPIACPTKRMPESSGWSSPHSSPPGDAVAVIDQAAGVTGAGGVGTSSTAGFDVVLSTAGLLYERGV